MVINMIFNNLQCYIFYNVFVIFKYLLKSEHICYYEIINWLLLLTINKNN